ncbi:hypothetical protein JTE90_007724 [Oedothorax gibbosus]|uniref:Retinol dehydrogenase 13 n=1 Tax=Oedothorax gibbosus TaxID=931172 RepID=A0AAV6V8K1_9ARAC|nr:hypothetical protein JTE90_007724 [Oedothorax gibbosus]
MDICIATAQEISYLIVHHPMYSGLGCLVVAVSLLKFYCRLTLGVCECDQDMTGNTVLITGASAGIGKATAFDMARRGARVLLACRNKGKADKVADEIRHTTGNQNVVVYVMDLCSFDSVRKCAGEVLKAEKRLDVLINNAGITGTTPQEMTEDGCEKIMQSNHLGSFLFTLLLLDLLKKSAPSRIVNVSSAAKNFAKFDVDDLVNKKKLSPMAVYSNTKLANVLFTVELAERLAGTGVTVNALHPGCVATDIFNGKTGAILFFTRVLFWVVAKSSEEGAQTTILLAVDPSLEKTTGKYFVDCKEEKLSKADTDKQVAKRLFEISEKIVGTSLTIKT